MSTYPQHQAIRQGLSWPVLARGAHGCPIRAEFRRCALTVSRIRRAWCGLALATLAEEVTR